MTWKQFARGIAALLLTMAMALGPTRPALAQSAQESARMRLYVQQLEEQIRQLTGEVERLQFALRRAQAGLGAAPEASGAENLAGSIIEESIPGGTVVGGTVNAQNNASIVEGAPPQNLGSLTIAVDDPRIAADGVGPADGNVAGAAAPLDLSVLAGGAGIGLSGRPGLDQSQPPLAPAPLTTALSGSPRDEYDLSYGYILTGDYDLAEQRFRSWLQSFADHELALDARFWLAESLFQQGKNREAANGFLEVYKSGSNSRKAPDALMKLGVSLAALGERDAACATFSEMAIKFPDVSSILTDRVAREAKKARC